MSVPESFVRPGLTATTDWGRRPPRTRCRVGADLAEGSRFVRELAGLLHRRLRVVSLIAFAPTLWFLVRNLLDGHHEDTAGPAGAVVHTMVTALVGWLA